MSHEVSKDLSKEWPSVSVIVLNYMGRSYLERCIRSILNTDYPDFEIILVDNGSTDGSVEYVKEKFSFVSTLRIVHNEINLGIAEGFNSGMRNASGDYVILQENDIEVDPDWLKELVKVLEKDPTIGAAQGKILQSDYRTIDCAGGFIDSFGLTYRRGQGEIDRGQHEKIEEIFIGHSVGIAFRRSLLDKIGLFDPNFSFDKFDTDLCWRIWLSGYKVLYIPSSITYHGVGGTKKSMAKRKLLKKPIYRKYRLDTLFHSSKSIITLSLKNYGLRNLLKYVPLHIVLLLGMNDYIVLKERDPMILWHGFLKAILWNVSNFRDIWLKRKKNQLITRVHNSTITKKFHPAPLRLYQFLHKSIYY